jgi:hypothetical protein
LFALHENELLRLNVDVATGPAHQLNPIFEASVWSGWVRKFNTYREKSIRPSLPQNLVYPSASDESVHGAVCSRLRKPGFIEEAQGVKKIALASHIRADQNVERAQGKVEASEALEVTG